MSNKKNTIECVVQLISPFMINNSLIVISISSGFIDERDEGVWMAVVNKIIFYGNGI